MIAPPVAREEAVFRRKHPPDVFFAVPLRAVSCQHVRRKKGVFLFHGIFGIVAAELIRRFDNLQHGVGEARIVNAVQNAPYNRRLLRRRRNDPRFAVDQLRKGFNLRRVRHISRHRPARRGRQAAEAGLTALVTYGPEAARTAKAAKDAGLADVVHAEDYQQAADALLARMAPGDALLVKASRGMALEKALALFYPLCAK